MTIYALPHAQTLRVCLHHVALRGVHGLSAPQRTSPTPSNRRAQKNPACIAGF
ncbi:hypothetical protein [Acetobacter papayae]|uniref:hypothetical protein n=1 Tax=Acetobacter papayae TaxID=1076592 RepID=UPI000A8A48C6|nr:hypothetical protein [Acetobacter papayae]